MIECATLPTQRSVVSTVSDIAGAAAREGLHPPALLVVGPAVRHAERLDWYRRLPLAGERLVAPTAGPELVRALEEAGAEVLVPPLPITPAARVALEALPLTGCILRSPAEAEALPPGRDGSRWEEGAVAWCLGPSACGRARERGWPRVEELPLDPDPSELVSRLEGGGTARG
jgi:hypothetical protein